MKLLLHFCLNNRLLTAIILAAACATAFWQVRRLPVDVFPELDLSRVTLQTEAPGLTADEVEAQLSMPLEAAMGGLRYVTRVKSSSGRGLSFVWVDFEEGVDPYRVRQIIAERLASIRSTLPAGTSTEISPVVSVTGEIMLVAIYAPTQELEMQVRHLAEYTLRRQLLSISGVGQVAILGGRLPEYRVSFDPLRLSTFGLSSEQLFAAVQSSQSRESAGYLTNYKGREWPLRQQGLIHTIDDLKSSIISGTQLQINDVANVGIQPAIRSGSAAYGHETAIVLAVQKAPGGNTLALTKQVDVVLDRFEKVHLPEGTTLHRDGYRQADFINLSMENGKNILIEASLIVIAVILFTLWNIRLALIILVSMPISILLGFLLFPMLGLGINIMTLGGLAVAVGDVVDNAVIFVENAWRRLHRKPEESLLTVMLNAGAEVAPAMFFSTIIIVLVFLPLIFLTGIEGQFFRPMALAYCVALLGSLFIALTLIPVLMISCGVRRKQSKPNKQNDKPQQPRGESIVVRLIKAIYTPILMVCIKFRFSTLIFAIVAVGATIYVAKGFGTTFLPPFHEDCYTVFVSAVPGTSLEESEALAQKVTDEILKIPGVRTAIRRTGRAERDEHAEPVSSSEIQVRVDLSKDQDELKAAFHRILKQIPGISGMVGYPIAHRISAVISGTNADITVNLVADDLVVLREAARQAKAILDETPSVTDIQANREVLVDALTIRYRPFDLSRYGLTREAVALQVAMAFGGVSAGEVSRNTSRWELVVQLEQSERNTPEDLQDFLVTTDTGEQIPLNRLADIYPEQVSNLIIREQGQRQALITCNPAQGANVGDIVATLRKTLDPVMQKLGVSVNYGGTIEARDSTRRQLTILGIVLGLTIILLLSYALRAIRYALLILINVPLALIGGILAMVLTTEGTAQPIISVTSLAGFITLFGFAIRNGLLLLNRYITLTSKGYSVKDAIIEGSRERITPILMTSLTTILGLIPIVLARSTPGGEVLAPLAIVQFGGLISATCLNLLILPAAASYVLKPHVAKLEEEVVE